MIATVSWIVATTVGLIGGGFLFRFPGSFAGQVEWSLSAATLGLVLGLLTGAGVGLLQSAALRLPRNTGSRLVLDMGRGLAPPERLQ